MPKELFNQPLFTSPNLPEADHRIAFGKPGVPGGRNMTWAYFDSYVAGKLIANVLANLGVGAFANRPDISTTTPGDIYVSDDTFIISTAVDSTTYFDRPLTKSQLVTDSNVDPYKIYQYDGVNLKVVVDTQQQFQSNVTYYLDNASSDIPTYEGLLRSPATIVEQLETINLNNNTVIFDSYATPPNDPGVLEIPAGLWTMHAHVQFSAITGDNFVHFDMYKRAAGGAETFLFRMSTDDITSTALIEHQISAIQAAVTLLDTDRLVLKVYAQTTGGAKTATLHYSGIENFAFVQTAIVDINTITHNNTTGKQLAANGVTWGHVDDQAQSIKGVKTFVDSLVLSNTLVLADTTSSTTGVILKGANRFIHNFHHPVGGGAVPTGRNLFIGELAGNFSTGSTATSSIQASANVGVGYQSLISITTGYENTAVGYATLVQTLDGYQNTACGGTALNLNTSGYQNVANGNYSLSRNTTGFRNIAIGFEAGRYVSSGGDNTNSDNSIFIGCDTRPFGNNATNQIVIGNGAIGVGGNTAVIGNDSITKTILKGSIGVGTSTPFAGFEMRKNGAGYWNDSNGWTNESPPLSSLVITNSTNGGYDPVIIYRQTDSSGSSDVSGAIGLKGTGAWTSGNNAAKISDMYFAVRNSSGGISERFRITSSGNIGNVASPTSKLQIAGLNSYADNAAAVTAGLTAGAFYHTAGVLKVVI